MLLPGWIASSDQTAMFVYVIHGFLLVRLAATTKWRFLSLPKGQGWPLFAYVLEVSFLLSLSNF